MSSDTTLTDDEGNKYSFENLATQKWLEGFPQGALSVCHHLREKAADLFRAEKHDEAIKLQKLAADIQATLVPEMEKRAAVHKKTHPYELGKK